ncbi:AAA family ATPase [Nonomuraea typhae]|uniref:AAA family ATPase n=1 Tax=Nonomuraea typhae TaxID=2603600 RepID=A0ABW7Z5S8_9ACTN
MTSRAIDDVLTFPEGSLVILTGLPGAGKSTLLTRLYGLTGAETAPVPAGAGVRIIDSRQARNTWSRRLSAAPKPLRTLVVHLTHVSRIARALAAGHTVVAHNRGAWPHVLYGFAHLARRNRREFHLIMLDVDARTALAGQRARGRVVSTATLRRHGRRWRRLVSKVRRGDPAPATSVTLLSREHVDALRLIRFVPGGYSAAPRAVDRQGNGGRPAGQDGRPVGK